MLRQRLAHEPDIQIEAHVSDVPALLAAQQIARAADLQILHRDVHARAQISVLGDGGQPLMGGLGQRCLG